MKNIKLWGKILTISLTTLAVGCTHFGSYTLPPDRIRYNKSIVNSELQQLLLNLVRLRFGDTPQFISLNNIVSQFNYQGGVAADFNRGTAPAYLSTTVDIAPNVSYSEAPTITYTPMQGEEFVTRLLTPVDVRVLKMFMRDGWGVGRILRTFVQTFGPLSNAVVASRPTASRRPIYKGFNMFTETMRQLQHANGFVAENDNSDDVYKIHITVTKFNILDKRSRELLAILGITPSHPDFWVCTEYSDLPRHFTVETRTVLSIFNYLSKGVEVPPEQRKFTGEKPGPNGAYFDWQQVVGGLMDVKYSRLLPKEAYVYVHYRGYYFYIDDKDNNTKETLNLLNIVNGIFQGNIQSVLPVFTVS